MTDLVFPSPRLAGHVTPVGPARTAVEPADNPRVIDGEVTASWFPRPITPMLLGSGVLLGIGIAALVQEIAR